MRSQQTSLNGSNKANKQVNNIKMVFMQNGDLDIYIKLSPKLYFVLIPDPSIDDRFKQSLMTNLSNNLQKIVSINLKKNSVHEGLSSKGKCREYVEASGSDYHCSAV